MSFSSPAQERPVPKSPQDSPIYRRARWFFDQRAYPLGYIPAGAHEQALQQLDQMLAAEGRLGPRPSRANIQTAAPSNPPASSANGTTWTPIGPQSAFTVFKNSPVSGRVSALAVDPTNASIVYAGGAEGGVWKTTDGGANWTPLTDQQASLAVGSIAIDDTGAIWVGTGEANFGLDNYYGAGILKSTNGGTDWTLIGQSTFGQIPNAIPPTIGGAYIGALAVQPGSSGQTALAGVKYFGFSNTSPASGIYRTANGGTTWTAVLAGAAGTEVAFDPNNASNCGSSCRAYAVISATFGDSTDGFYISTDSGQTWPTKASLPNFVATNTGRITMGLAKNNNGAATVKTTIYLGVSDSNGSTNLVGIWKSTDGGQSWSQLSNPPNYCVSQCFYDNIIRVKPDNDNVVFAGGSVNQSNLETEVLWRSTDGGSTWTDITSDGTNELHVDMHAIAFSADNSKMYVGNDGGVWSTPTPAGTITWTNLNASSTDATKSLAILQFYPGMAISSPTYIFGGTQDNGSQLFTGNVVWSMIACGDGGWSAIDPNNNNILYTACNDIDVEKSTTTPQWGSFGSSTNSAGSGINTGDRSAFIPPLVLDPTTSGSSAILYFGTFHLYQTTNAATSWITLGSGADLTGGGSATVSTISVSPVSHNTVWVGTSDGKVQVTTNANLGGSATFTDKTGTLPHRYVTQVAVDPSDNTGNTVYAAFSGFTVGTDTQGHIFKTVNGGSSWNDISGNLPNTPVNDIVADPALANTVYIATDVGVFYTTNADAGSPTWNTLVTGLPKVAVLSLKLHASSRTLVAGTHGRSAWSVLIGSPISLQPSSVAFGNLVLNSYGTIPVTFANNSGSAITINSISLTGVFTQTNNCPGSLGNGATCTISVTFHPTSLGAQSGTLSVNDTGTGSPHQASVSGTGVDLTLVLSRPMRRVRSDANLVVAGRAAQVPLVLSSGGAAATVSLACYSALAGISCSVQPAAVSLKGEDAPVTVTIRAAGGLARGTLSSVQVVADAGSVFRTLSIPVELGTPAGRSFEGQLDSFVPPQIDTSPPPPRVLRNGSGLTANSAVAPSFVLSPDKLQFGPGNGDNGSRRRLTVTNLQALPLAINGISLSVPFEQTNDCGPQLSAGASCSIEVSLKAGSASASRGVLKITTSAGEANVELSRTNGAAKGRKLSSEH